MADLHVGVIGLGLMGRELAHRLIQNDVEVYGYDIDETALESAITDGVEPTESVQELVSESGIVLTSLPGPDSVKEVYLGPDGVIQNANPEIMLIETSTIDPGTTREINAVALEDDIVFLDAPVSGGIGRAKKGTLTVMVGGDEAVFEDERIQAVLKSFGSDIFYGGETGSGHTLKLLNNMISAATGVVALEGAVLAAEVGVDWEVFLDVVNTASGSSYNFRQKVPRVLNRNFDATFTLNMGVKDARLILDLAESVDYPAPMANAMHQIRMAGVKKGYGEEGTQTIVKVFEEFANNRVEYPGGFDEDYLSWEDKP